MGTEEERGWCFNFSSALSARGEEFNSRLKSFVMMEGLFVENGAIFIRWLRATRLFELFERVKRIFLS
jgi:hypothetical protein